MAEAVVAPTPTLIDDRVALAKILLDHGDYPRKMKRVKGTLANAIILAANQKMPKLLELMMKCR